MALTSKKLALGLSAAVLLAGLTAGCGSGDQDSDASPAASPAAGAASSPKASGKPVTLTLLTDNTVEGQALGKAYADGFMKKYPNIKIEMETRPGGGEGDNIVKTRLSTGDMTDVFFYNSGSLMQALRPEDNLVDITNEAFQANVMDSFKTTVTSKGKLYGVPAGGTMGGGWFYNKKVYKDLGLSVPKTWAELLANNEKIKAAGLTPVIGTYKDDWTSQLIFLADYYNVQQANPKFADDFTANKAKFSTDPAAFRSFEKLEEINKKGYLNKDFISTNYDSGLKMLAEGKGAHYPMLTFAIPALDQNYKDKMNDIGFFAQPGDSAEKNGLTVWMPGAAYIYSKGKHIEEAKRFLGYIASAEGVAALEGKYTPSGPFVIKGAKLPDNAPQIVKDMVPYFDSGNNAPALEFVSPIKGASLPQITQTVGAGIKSAKEGAEMYDKDVEKSAKQLGLQGW